MTATVKRAARQRQIRKRIRLPAALRSNTIPALIKPRVRACSPASLHGAAGKPGPGDAAAVIADNAIPAHGQRVTWKGCQMLPSIPFTDGRNPDQF